MRNPSPELLRIQIRLQSLKRWMRLNFYFIILFLAGTAFIHFIYGESKTDFLSRNVTASYFLSQFNLSSENTLASWYSSMLLFQTFIMAAVCFSADKQGERRSLFRFGWLFIALFFLVLSLDEIGSLHENAGRISSMDVIGDGGWQSVIAVPLLLVLIYMGIFAWKHLKPFPQSFLLFFIGALLLLSLPFHEAFEMQSWSESGYSQTWKRPILLVLAEEGSELFASFCFFSAMILAMIGQHAESKSLHLKFHTGRATGILLLFFAALMGLASLLYLVTETLNADEGIALNWFPSASAFGVSFLLAYSNLKAMRPFAFLFALLSAFFGTNFYTLMQWSEINALRYMVGSVIFIGTLLWLFSNFRFYRSFLDRVLIFLTAGAVCSSVIIPDLRITMVAFIAFTAIILILVRRSGFFVTRGTVS
jgi:hypothetical protein